MSDHGIIHYASDGKGLHITHQGTSTGPVAAYLLLKSRNSKPYCIQCSLHDYSLEEWKIAVIYNLLVTIAQEHKVRNLDFYIPHSLRTAAGFSRLNELNFFAETIFAQADLSLNDGIAIERQIKFSKNGQVVVRYHLRCRLAFKKCK